MVYTNGLMQIIWLLTLINLNMFALPLLSQFLIVMFICNALSLHSVSIWHQHF